VHLALSPKCLKSDYEYNSNPNRVIVKEPRSIQIHPKVHMKEILRPILLHLRITLEN